LFDKTKHTQSLTEPQAAAHYSHNSRKRKPTLTQASFPVSVSQVTTKALKAFLTGINRIARAIRQFN